VLGITNAIYYKFKKSSYSSDELIKNFFKRRITIGIGNTLISGNIIRENNLQFQNYQAGTDNHFFRNLLRYVKHGFSVPNVLFFYYVNNNSIMTSTYSKDRIDSILSVIDTKKIFEQNRAANELISSLDVFLINEIRGNALDYLLSKQPFYSRAHWLFVAENILIYMPKKLEIKVFIGAERMLWSLSNLYFYIFPRIALYTYIVLFNLRKNFENFIK
jgi:hypothetical protein